MRNNETGEFELVVGNRQLLSGFFIVVLLFAVAFAMGYVVGQNSPRTARLQAEAAGSSSPTPASDGRPQPAPPPAPVSASQRPENPPAQPTGETPSQPTTQAPPQPTTQPARAGSQPAVVAAAPPPALESAPGTYWQVMAVPQPDAEVVVRTLKDKGFPASLTQGPNNLMRVLVGPFADTQTMGKAKTDLENAGFHPIRK
jgi:cell division septation protein DedD